MNLFRYSYSYIGYVFVWWVTLVSGVLGLNELVEYLFHRSIKLIHRHKWRTVVVLLIVAQTLVHHDLSIEHQALVAGGRELVMSLKRQDQPALRYSLGGSTNVYNYYPVPFNRWVPITDFRDVTLEWTREREAIVEGLVSFSALGAGDAKCRLRLVDVASGSPVAVTDSIGRPAPEPFAERVDVPFVLAVPRGEGRMVYRLEITSDKPNGDMVASADIVFSYVGP